MKHRLVEPGFYTEMPAVFAEIIEIGTRMADNLKPHKRASAMVLRMTDGSCYSALIADCLNEDDSGYQYLLEKIGADPNVWVDLYVEIFPDALELGSYDFRERICLMNSKNLDALHIMHAELCDTGEQGLHVSSIRNSFSRKHVEKILEKAKQ